jgi:hypothetical protein
VDGARPAEGAGEAAVAAAAPVAEA